jgi:membrane protease YdiL (CAAX protease family)
MNYNIDYLELYEKEKRRGIRKTFSRFALSLVFYILISYLAIFLLEIALIYAFGKNEALLIFDSIYFQWFSSVGISYLIGLPVLLFITHGMKKAPVREKKRLDIKDFLLSLTVCQALTLAGSLLGQMFTGTLSEIFGKDISAPASDLIDKSPLLLTFAIAVIIGPIVEEFIFRKLLIDRISRFGDLTAIIASGLIFGVFHANFEQFFYAALLGMFFAFIYTKTGSWLYTTLLHIFVNFVGTVVAIPVINASERVLNLMANGTPEFTLEYVRDSILVTSYSILQYAAVGIGIYVIISSIRKKKLSVAKNSEIYIPTPELWKNAVLNLGIILFIAVSFLQFLAGILL